MPGEEGVAPAALPSLFPRQCDVRGVRSEVLCLVYLKNRKTYVDGTYWEKISLIRNEMTLIKLDQDHSGVVGHRKLADPYS